jgi:S-DNA-T family DNA segregation ATPase FtsK/SpoIIIE
MAQRRSKRNKGGGSGIPEEVKQTIFAVLLIAIGLLMFFSLFGSAGVLGEWINYALSSVFGLTRYVFVVLFLIFGWNILIPSRAVFGTLGYIGSFLFIIGLNGLINLILVENGSETLEVLQGAGGYMGLLLSSILFGAIGMAGAFVLGLALMVIGAVLGFEVSFDAVLSAKDRVKEKMGGLVDGDGPILARAEDDDDDDIDFDEEEDDNVLIEPEEEEVEEVEEDAEAEDEVVEEDVEEEAEEVEEKVMTSKHRRRVQIPADLLDEQSTDAVSGDVDKDREVIRKTFAHFGIDVEMAEHRVGPTVTQYAMKPPSGVKLAKIVSLQNDLALALAAHPIRIEAPIPGKSLVGIEVPNETIGAVGLRELMESKEFKDRKSGMTAPLGKDVGGNVVSMVVDKAPHMLVAGATGSGKSVCLNTIIVSLLYQNGPDDMKMIMVDPKRVELGRYAGIPHLLTPPIVKPEEAVNALKWAVREMERRLDHLAKFGVRDIDSYNKKSKEKMPKIIIVIDELADLMSTANKRDVEAVIVRIAQMARAAGIHLILATQRPSVDVITGVIKANIPTRLAFAVASQVDSKTILDVSGAEKLLGRGDMLISTPQISKPKRLQGAFVSDEEIERVVEFLKKEGEPDYNYTVLETEKTGGTVMEDSGEDPMIDEAIQIVLEVGKASTSYLQRKLRIGYSRAARIIDIMSEMGVISEANGSKPREVLITEWPPKKEAKEVSEKQSTLALQAEGARVYAEHDRDTFDDEIDEMEDEWDDEDEENLNDELK